MAVQPFLGEIYMFAGNFEIRNTKSCQGQLLPIAQYTALFSILGTTYGGNGTTNFALPNLQGNVPVGQGNLPGGSEYILGQNEGSEYVILSPGEIPAHRHNNQLTAAMNTGNGTLISDPVGAYPATVASGTNLYASSGGSGFMTPLNSNLMGNTAVQGGSQPHNNMQPYLAVTFLIATAGVFPARN